MKINKVLATQLIEGLEKLIGAKVVLKEWDESDKAAYLAYKKDSGIKDQDEEDLDSYEGVEPLNEEGEAEVAAQPELRRGERVALSRGNDLSSAEQYALMYVIVSNMVYQMGTPYNNMDGKTLASQAGIKDGTFAKRARCIKNYLEGDTTDAHQLDQKGIEIITKLQALPKEKVLQFAKKAFDPATVKAIMDKRAAQQKKPVQPAFKAPAGKVSIKDMSPEQLANINAKRAERGLEPLSVNECVKFLNKLVESIEKSTGKKIRFVESDSKKISEQFEIRDVRANVQRYKMQIVGATKKGAPDLANKLKLELKSYLNDIGYQWETDPETAEILGEAVELNEGILDIFSTDPIKKINKALQSAVKIADDVNFYTNFYYFPDQWSGDETDEVKRRIQNIWSIMSKGTGLTESVEVKETKQLNEWFAKSNYNKLLKKLDEIARYADQVVAKIKKSKSPQTAAELQTMNQEILSNLKKVWQVFVKSKISNTTSFAGDDINKLSAKQKMNKKAQPAQRIALNPQQDQAGVA